MAVAASAAEVVRFTPGPPAYVASSLTAHGPVQWAYQQPYYYYYNYRQAPATAAQYVAVQPAGAVAGLAPVVQVQRRPGNPAYTLAYRSRVAGDATDRMETRRGDDEASGRYTSSDTAAPTGSERTAVQHANEAANAVRADATGRASAAPPKSARTTATLAVPENKPGKTGY